MELKKILIIILAVLLAALIVCLIVKSVQPTQDPQTTLPADTEAGGQDTPAGKDPDWETPIDVDDSFIANNTTVPDGSADTPLTTGDAEEKDPAQTTRPGSSGGEVVDPYTPETTEATPEPETTTKPAVSDPKPTEPPATEPEQEQETTKAPVATSRPSTNKDGAIELPMIPG